MFQRNNHIFKLEVTSDSGQNNLPWSNENSTTKKSKDSGKNGCPFIRGSTSGSNVNG